MLVYVRCGLCQVMRRVRGMGSWRGNARALEELDLMSRLSVKAELQSLYKKSSAYLTEQFLPQKLVIERCEGL